MAELTMQDFEVVLQRLPFVLKAQVMTSEAHPTSVEVLTDSQAPTKELLRDILVTMRSMGVLVSSENITLIRVAESSSRVLRKPFSLERYQLRHDGTLYRVQVQLSRDDRDVMGTGHDTGLARAIALAAIAAVQTVEPYQYCTLNHIDVVASGGLQIVLATIRDGQRLYSGSSIIFGRLEESVLEAMLSVINQVAIPS